MPVFSFTAPHITPEEERQERESLTPEAAQELEDDLYGLGTDFEDETEELIESAMKEVELIIDTFPDAKKKDYLEARNQVPHLIESEANPIKFLRCEKFDSKVSETTEHYGLVARP